MADIYEVTGQEQVGAFGPTGRPEQMVRVTFKTVPYGDIASVDVPVGGFDHDAVEAAIRPYAAELIRARGL